MNCRSTLILRVSPPIKQTVTALFCTLVWSCAGGSGSSGFITENAAIGAALEQQSCVEYEGLEICAIQTAPAIPPHSPTPSGSPGPGTPTATPTLPTPRGDSEVLFNAPLEGTRDCVPTDFGCSFSVQFSTRGFPEGSAFYLAVRENPPQGVWNLSLAGTAAGPADFGGTVPVTGPRGPDQPEPTSVHVQIAVLVYFTPPASVTTPVQELVDAGPDAAFVSTEFEVRTF